VDETLAARIAAEAAYHHPSIKKSQERKRPISCASFFSLSLLPSFFTFFFNKLHIHTFIENVQRAITTPHVHLIYQTKGKKRSKKEKKKRALFCGKDEFTYIRCFLRQVRNELHRTPR
jgi:hypothetical protein